jgi:CBS domain-containing protein
MEIELVEIRDFLAARHPFDALPEDALDRLPKALSVRYLRRGTPFPPADADGRYLYILRQGAVEMRDRQGDLIDKLGEGDLYSSSCGEIGLESAMTSITAEDTLLYLLPCRELEALRRDHPAFGRHFEASLAERLKKAIDLLQQTYAGGTRLSNVAVASLLRRPPVLVTMETTIREAAQRMTNERVASLLVLEGDALAGLVTDRDLRSRCVAAGVDTARPVSEIMTTQVHTVGASTLVVDALMQMTRMNIHHLPVTDAGRLLGVVSATDLIRYESANAVYLVGDVLKAGSVEALTGISRKIPELQVQLAGAGASSRHVGEAISAVNDAITRRLLELAEQQLGAPRARFAWVTGGSLARREQTSHSDQDNALILEDGLTPDDERHFEALARFVTDGLDGCGLVYCPGGVMASNSKWRQPRAQWRNYFDRWIEQPDPMALMLFSLFFDLRVVHGDASLLEVLQRENLERTRTNGIFLAHMARNALSNRPPLGFFRNLVLIRGGAHDRTFDIKRRGILPVVDLARVYALAEGRAELNTVDRLRAAAGTPAVTAEGAQNLEDAYEFVATLRVQHQARQLRAAASADNHVAPEELSALERDHLKDAFGVIEAMQQTLEMRYQSGRFR